MDNKEVDDLIRHELPDIMAEVINNSSDKRIPQDTLWYSAGTTLADAIVARLLIRLEETGEKP